MQTLCSVRKDLSVSPKKAATHEKVRKAMIPFFGLVPLTVPHSKIEGL